MRHFHRALGEFAAHSSANISMVMALALPVLLGAAALSIEFSGYNSRQAQLQAAADSAAIAAARHMRLGNASADLILATAQSHAAASLSASQIDFSFQGKVASNRSSVTVELTSPNGAGVASVLGLLHDEARALAEAVVRGGAPLCLVALDPGSSGTIDLEKSSKVQANDCAVYSNSTAANGVNARDNAVLKSAFTCSAGGFVASGASLSPRPDVDCPRLPDPLSSRPPPSYGACEPTRQNLVIDVDTYLTPGVYCGGITVRNSVIVTLQPGVYVIKDGGIVIKNGGRLQGVEVGLFFTGDNASLDLKQNSSLSLTAPKTGPMAGLLIYQDRNATEQKFELSSDDASMLLGTIYLPNGLFYLGGAKPLAQSSAFTIVIAKRVLMSAGPTLVLNSNYGASDTPTPNGVGPLSNELALKR